MSPGLTTERVYAVLKAQIMEGERATGERLDPAKLASELNASATPVRDALHQLLGERLVQASPGHGFQVPQLSETGLRDLYGWNGDLMALLLRTWTPKKPRQVVVPARQDDSPEAAAELFDMIAATLGSPEHRRAVRQASDRLHRARKAEAEIFDDITCERNQLAAAWTAGEAAALRAATTRYHRRRQKAVALIAARMAGLARP